MTREGRNQGGRKEGIPEVLGQCLTLTSRAEGLMESGQPGTGSAFGENREGPATPTITAHQ